MILDLLFGRRSAENPSRPYWEGATDYGVKSDSGLDISYATALRYSPWWRGINLVSSDVAKLPRAIFKRVGEGKERDTKHPAYKIVRRKASSELTARIFIQTLTANAMACGNGYAFIDRDTDARPREMRWFDPLVTYPMRENGVHIYATMINNVWRKILPENVFHLRGVGFDGLSGYPVYKIAADSLGLGIGAQKFGSVFFRNNARPSVIIETPQNMTKEAQATFLEQWNRMHGGLEAAHRTAILTMGAKANPFAHNARDSQLLETREFEIREVANWLGVPAHKLGDRTRTAYASLEQENHSYLVEALDQWLCAWEDEWTDKLLTEAQKESESHVVEFNRNALVRASFAERMAGYNVGIQSGWINRDEVRDKENMNPLPNGEGQKYYQPLNMQVVGGKVESPKIQGGTLDALQSIIISIVKDEIPPEAGKVMIQAAYPGLEDAEIDKMIKAAEEAEAPVEPQPVAAVGQPEAEPAEESDADDERVVQGFIDKAQVLQQYRDARLDELIRLATQQAEYEKKSAETLSVGMASIVAHCKSSGEAFEMLSAAVNEQTRATFAVCEKHEKLSDDVHKAFDSVSRAFLQSHEGWCSHMARLADAITRRNISDEQRAELEKACREQANDIASRMCKRIGISARKAAKKPAEFLAWLNDELPSHVAVVDEAIAPAVRIWRALERVGQPANEVAASWVAKWAAELLEHSGKCQADNMQTYMDGAISELEKTLKQTLITMIGD